MWVGESDRFKMANPRPFMNAGPVLSFYKWLLSMECCANDQTLAKALIYEPLIR